MLWRACAACEVPVRPAINIVLDEGAPLGALCTPVLVPDEEVDTPPDAELPSDAEAVFSPTLRLE